MSCMLMEIPCISHLQHLSNPVTLGKPLKNLRSSRLFSKGTSNISKGCAAFCPDLKQNLTRTHFSLHSAIFSAHQYNKWTNTHLYLTIITQPSALF